MTELAKQMMLLEQIC